MRKTERMELLIERPTMLRLERSERGIERMLMTLTSSSLMKLLKKYLPTTLAP